MNFFIHCKTKEDAKQIFHRLSKCFHPDKGGDNHLMMELNKQYNEWNSEVKDENNSNGHRIYANSHLYTYVAPQTNPKMEVLEAEIRILKEQIKDPHFFMNKNIALKKELKELKEEFGNKKSESFYERVRRKRFEVECEDLKKEVIKLKQEIEDMLKPTELHGRTLFKKIKYILGIKSDKRNNNT